MGTLKWQNICCRHDLAKIHGCVILHFRRLLSWILLTKSRDDFVFGEWTKLNLQTWHNPWKDSQGGKIKIFNPPPQKKNKDKQTNITKQTTMNQNVYFLPFKGEEYISYLQLRQIVAVLFRVVRFVAKHVSGVIVVVERFLCDPFSMYFNDASAY